MRPIRRFAKLLVAAAAAALSHQIRGDDLVYVAPGGDWSVAANWSEQYVPATGDTTNLPGSGTMNTVITFDNAAPVVNLSSNTIDYTGAAGGSDFTSGRIQLADSKPTYLQMRNWPSADCSRSPTFSG